MALGQQGPRWEDRRPGFQATVTLPLVIPGKCVPFLELLGLPWDCWGGVVLGHL